jgi:hypothetical protein
MNFGSMPGCGVNKDKTTFTGATGDDVVAECTSVSLVGGLEEQGGALSLAGIEGFAGGTEGRSSLVSSGFLSAAALLSALALVSALFAWASDQPFFLARHSSS